MRRCAHCGQRLDAYDERCPRCLEPAASGGRSGEDFDRARSSAPGPETDEAAQTVVARFGNAAEAGFFAHELMQSDGIPASISLDENFDALSGFWSIRYALGVPDHLAEQAAIRLRELIAQFSDPEEPPGVDGEASERRPFSADPALSPDDADEYAELSSESGVNWLPIVLTLAAGSAAFWGVRALHVEKPPPAAAAGGGQNFDVWEHLSTPAKPWVQQLEAGGRRELWIDADRHEGVLREDLDGDGRFESEIPVRRLLPAR